MNTHVIGAVIGFFIVLVVAGLWYSYTEAPTIVDPVPTPTATPVTPTEDDLPIIQTYKDIIRLTTPAQGDLIESPLTLTGEARGMWYFEASFPVMLTNWDGLIIAEGIAQAQSDWMTEEYVPFEVTLTFEPPYKVGDPDFMQKGALILKKDNPSGLPENDDAFETTVLFLPSQS
jgi:hypothetical protein